MYTILYKHFYTVYNSFNSIIFNGEGRDKLFGEGADISWMYMCPKFNTEENL